VKHRFRNGLKYVQILPGSNTVSGHNLLVAKICTILKSIIRIRKGKPRWGLKKLHAQRQEVQDALEEKLCAMQCEGRNVEVQLNSIKTCVRYNE
jgi:hypothetical protein